MNLYLHFFTSPHNSHDVMVVAAESMPDAKRALAAEFSGNEEIPDDEIEELPAGTVRYIHGD